MGPFATAAARLDRLPVGRFHRRLMWLIGLGMFFDTFDITIMGGILATLVSDGWSTLSLNTHYISVTFLGLSVGAALAGAVGDRFGRRFVYQFNLLVFGVTCILSAFAPSMFWLILLRGLMGVGLGAEFVVGYALVSEFMPPAFRGRAAAIVALIGGFGGVAVGLLSAIVIPHFGWRPMFAVGGIGALWVWYLRSSLPDSPRWLEAVGRGDEADTVLRRLEAEASATGSLPPFDIGPTRQAAVVPLRVLFSPAVVRRTLLAMAIGIVCLVGSYSFVSWAPTFFVHQGVSVTRSLWFETAITAGYVAGNLVSFLVTDRIGRRWGIVVGALACGAIGSVYPFLTSFYAIVPCGFLLLTAMQFLINLGLGGYMPELFPTEYRFRGAAAGQFAGRVALIGAPYAVVAVFAAYGGSGVVACLAGLYAALALGVAIFGFETNRQSLEALNPHQTVPAVPIGTASMIVPESRRETRT